MKSRVRVELVWQKMLAEWLQQWQLEGELMAVPDPPAEQDESLTPYSPVGEYTTAAMRRCESYSKRINRGGNALAAGDVVLLSPDSEVTQLRPVYLALLSPLPGGGWLGAPFSRFSAPATPGEFLTHHPARPLAVLMIWNCGVVADESLARGWLTSRLGAVDLRWALQMHATPEGVFTAALERRRGAPLIHPLDPRHDYLEEERLLWLADSSRMLSVGEGEAGMGLPLAAEEIEPYLPDNL